MKTIQLQGIGKTEARSVNNLKVGDVIMWNYGYTSEVVNIEESGTGKTRILLLKSNTDGITRSRRLANTRLVAIA